MNWPTSTATVHDSEMAVPLTEEALSLLIGKQISIEYVDKRGVLSTRTVTPKGFSYFHGYRALNAFCHLRNGDRFFLLQRIRRCDYPGWSGLIAAHRSKQRATAIEQLALTRKRMIGLALAVFASLGGCAFARTNMTPPSVSVSGYTRRDGTYVHGYNRRPPGSVSHDSPFVMIQLASFVVMAGAGLGWWFTHGEAKRLKKRIKALS